MHPQYVVEEFYWSIVYVQYLLWKLVCLQLYICIHSLHILFVWFVTECIFPLLQWGLCLSMQWFMLYWHLPCVLLTIMGVAEWQNDDATRPFHRHFFWPGGGAFPSILQLLPYLSPLQAWACGLPLPCAHSAVPVCDGLIAEAQIPNCLMIWAHMSFSGESAGKCGLPSKPDFRPWLPTSVYRVARPWVPRIS